MGIFSKKEKPKTTSSTPNGSSNADSVILDSIRDALFILRSDGNIAFMNISAAALVNFDRNQAVGLNFLSVIHLLDKNGNMLADSQNPITRVLQVNHYLETRDFSVAKINIKETVPVCLTITPISNEPTSSKLVTMRDIAQELKDEQDRSEFISTASHEMRNPVASIEGYLALALNPQTASIDVRAHAYLDKAHEASQHLGKLFRDLLDSSKLDDGKLKTYPTPVEMTALVRNIADGMAPMIIAKGLNYSFGQTGAAAEAAPTGNLALGQVVYCFLDTDFLREIIDNVISNAVKYTSAGSVTVSVYGNNTDAIIVVADTGIGMDAEHQKHIFQKFYRVDNSQTRGTEGTGLGLYIVQQRAKAMDGRVWIESTEGKGTKFYIAFPRISTEEYNRRKWIADSAAQAQQSQNQPPSVPPLTPTAPIVSPPNG